MSLDDAIERAVIAAVEKALGPHLRRLADPEPLVYSVPECARVLATSTNTVRRLVDEGVLPTVPHMGQRVVIPRAAVLRLVESRLEGATTPPMATEKSFPGDAEWSRSA